MNGQLTLGAYEQPQSEALIKKWSRIAPRWNGYPPYIYVDREGRSFEVPSGYHGWPIVELAEPWDGDPSVLTRLHPARARTGLSFVLGEEVCFCELGGAHDFPPEYCPKRG